MKRNYRITNRLRFIIFITLMIIFITCIFNLAFKLNIAESLSYQEYQSLEIQNGDTLWNIAEDYMPSEMDIRKAVYEICKVNGISASELYAGMTIKIPLYQ